MVCTEQVYADAQNHLRAANWPSALTAFDTTTATMGFVTRNGKQGWKCWLENVDSLPAAFPVDVVSERWIMSVMIDSIHLLTVATA